MFLLYVLLQLLFVWGILEIKENFTLALSEWSEQLEREDKISDVFACYEQAFKLFPECEMVVNNLGAQLFRYVLFIDSNRIFMGMHLTGCCMHSYRLHWFT